MSSSVETFINVISIYKYLVGFVFQTKQLNLATPNLSRVFVTVVNMDYVGGNAEIITKNYKRLPEFECPVYCFSGEDNK